MIYEWIKDLHPYCVSFFAAAWSKHTQQVKMFDSTLVSPCVILALRFSEVQLRVFEGDER